MATLSCFADEIAEDLTTQMQVMDEAGVPFLELRAVDGIPVLELTTEKANEVVSRLQDKGMGVSAIGSPIGKILITDPFEPHLEKFKRALELAHICAADYIRLFSYFIPEGDDPAAYRDEVLRRMQEKAALAEQSGIVILHENESHIYGDIAARCKDIFDNVPSDYLRPILDPANFVQNGERSYDVAYQLYGDQIEYMHIKDAKLETGEVVPAGEGDGQMPEVLAALAERGYDGFLSLEPHLKIAGASSGFTGPDLFRTAVDALRKVAGEAGLPLDT